MKIKFLWGSRIDLYSCIANLLSLKLHYDKNLERLFFRIICINARAEILSWPRHGKLDGILDQNKTPRLIWARTGRWIIAMPSTEFITFQTGPR